MITGKQYAAEVEKAYKEKGGYIWGTAGKKWTECDQSYLERKYNNDPVKYSNLAQSARYGKKWIGRTVWDCSGLTSWAGKKFGLKFYHGSNSSWNKDCAKKGKITKGMKLPIGAWVYTGDDSSKPHIGTVTEDGVVTEAQGSYSGVVKTLVSNKKWKYWGLGKGIAFDFIPGETAPTTTKTSTKKPATKTEVKKHSTLRRGARGEEVKLMQSILAKDGSNLEVDGIFGIGTMSAVKSFQKRHNLVVDGIVGPKTWAELDKIGG